MSNMTCSTQTYSSYSSCILAINEYQKAKEIEDSQRTQDGLQRAQKLLKQSQKRDYYKILGVKRYVTILFWWGIFLNEMLSAFRLVK